MRHAHPHDRMHTRTARARALSHAHTHTLCRSLSLVILFCFLVLLRRGESTKLSSARASAGHTAMPCGAAGLRLTCSWKSVPRLGDGGAVRELDWECVGVGERARVGEGERWREGLTAVVVLRGAGAGRWRSSARRCYASTRSIFVSFFVAIERLMPMA